MNSPRVTHEAKVLALLSDGQPHSHHAGYALGVMLHSRVSNLRSKGYVINCWREGATSMYQLVGRPLEGGSATPLGVPACHAAESPSSGVASLPSSSPLDSWTEPNGREGRSQTALPAPVEASPSRDRGPFADHRSAPAVTSDAASVQLTLRDAA